MMSIEPIGNQWDYSTVETIQSNFEHLKGMEYRAIKALKDADPIGRTVHINGLEKTSERDMRNLSDYGTNFTAQVSGLIHRGWIYCSDSGFLHFGLAEQERDDVYSAIVEGKSVSVKAGWNLVTLNFPVEQNKSYTLFKRYIGESIRNDTVLIVGWADHPFIENGLEFNAGKFLNDSGTHRNYSPFFEIEFISNLAQIYKVLNDAVVPKKQYYVGVNPPNDSQLWFKPVGD